MVVCCDWLVLVVLFGGWCLGSVASAIVWCVGFVFYYLILLVWFSDVVIWVWLHVACLGGLGL